MNEAEFDLGAYYPIFAYLVLLLGFAARLLAQTVAVLPPSVEMTGREARQQLIVEATAGEHREDSHQRILRQVGLGGQILSDLNIRKIRLLSNTPTHVPALQGFNLEIVEQVPLSLATPGAR